MDKKPIKPTVAEDALIKKAALGDSSNLPLMDAELRELKTIPLIPNAETIEAMLEARAGKLQSFNSVDDLMAEFNMEN